MYPLIGVESMKLHNACYGRQHQNIVDENPKKKFETGNSARQNRIINSTSQLRNGVEHNAKIRPYSNKTNKNAATTIAYGTATSNKLK